ncbi:MAG TPA: ATPase, partial [Candidatus Hydrogenedentes bacterium]|nr:ATPase [Candidatus Hydrogenedentota bacterium]
MAINVEAVRRSVEQHAPIVNRLREQIGRVIVGQHYMVDRLLTAILANGHVLIEGVPGLAKTTAVTT